MLNTISYGICPSSCTNSGINLCQPKSLCWENNTTSGHVTNDFLYCDPSLNDSATVEHQAASEWLRQELQLDWQWTTRPYPPLVLLCVFDRHLPWKSVFHQRTPMCELRLRLICSIMLLHVWCDNNRMCPDSFFFKSDSVSAMHASRQVIQVRVSVFKLQINTYGKFGFVCLIFVHIATMWIWWWVQLLELYQADALFTILPDCSWRQECLVKSLFLLLTLQTFLKLCISLLSLFKLSERHHPSLPPTTSTSSSSVRAWQTADTSTHEAALSSKRRGQLHAFWNFVLSLTTFLQIHDVVTRSRKKSSRNEGFSC